MKKKNEIHIYESPDKSETLYLDTTKKVEISNKWILCRAATPNDMKRVNSDEKAELKTMGYVIKNSNKLRTTEKPSNKKLNP
jgi:hypothetical protein